MQKEIIIIGGGIIGLCTAYYLQKDGHKITVIDQSNMNSGASHVNAGYIIPSHFISMAAPGIINKGIKWMFNSESPFYIKPRLDADFLKWVLAFKKSATKERVEQSISALKNINLLSRDLYEDMKQSGDFNFHYERKGLLMCYKSNKVGEEEWEIGKRGIEEGLGVKHLSAKEVEVLEPKANLNIKGAVYYDCDGHMTPNHFMNDMVTYLKSKGVIFYTNEKVNKLEVFNEKVVKVLTDERALIPDEVILTAGSWSPLITKKLGIKIPVQAGKGYRINVEQETKITILELKLEELTKKYVDLIN